MIMSVDQKDMPNIDLVQKIIQLYEEEYTCRADSNDAMPHDLENPTLIRRKFDAFNIYKEYLKDKTRCLDWGCKNALDAYMIRKTISDSIEIQGCDIDKGKYEIFSKESGLIYSQLEHYYELPYPDNYFDVIIGSGVLEHVPNDRESLKELYRVMNKEGHLIITFLPNHFSYTEFMTKKVGGNTYHRRKYSINQIKKMLLHTGFVPIAYGYHQVLPSLSSLWSHSLSPTDARIIQAFIPIVSQFYKLNKYAEKVWPINKFASNIFIIGQKKSMI